MCGIAGMACIDKRPDKELLEFACQVMESRGPDSFSVKLDDQVGLAHRRLSIIDLSEGGNQPMFSTDGTISVTFNGEIYNYPALKKELQNLGYQFRTQSDTESIIALYQVKGWDGLTEKLDGMFAFCLHDRLKKKVYLARDRFGKKPLYYAFENKSLCFSSDIRVVAKFLAKKTLNTQALTYYFQELAMPQPSSIWNEINQVDSGEFLSFDLNTGSIEKKHYHQFSVLKVARTVDEVKDDVEQILLRAIEKRLLADVPVACFLSGGIDSGLIVALLAGKYGAKVNTFSVGFDDMDYNEIAHANALAKKYGTNHAVLSLQDDVAGVIPQILNDLGEPFADSSLIPSYLITRAMSSKYKVAISGDGGDELFGYPEYARIYRSENFLKKYPNSTQRKFVIASSRVLSRLSLSKNYGHMVAFEKELAEGHMLRRGMVFTANELNELAPGLKSDFTKNYLTDIWNDVPSTSITDKILVGSFHARLLNDYLVKVDRSSMMNSLEVRCPFLDLDLANYVLSVPNDILFNGGRAKFILKELAKKYVDPNIYQRKKTGFGMPLKQWLKGPIKEFMLDTLSHDSLKKHGLFDYAVVESLIRNHLSGSHNNASQLWSLMSFQCWYRNHGS